MDLEAGVLARTGRPFAQVLAIHVVHKLNSLIVSGALPLLSKVRHFQNARASAWLDDGGGLKRLLALWAAALARGGIEESSLGLTFESEIWEGEKVVRELMV